MNDRIFLRLSEKWALGSDKLQWILLQRNGVESWRGVAFIATERRILLRCIREKRVGIDAAAQIALDELPDTFREWRSDRRHSAVEMLEPPVWRDDANRSVAVVSGRM